ncbi:MAG: YlxR family protein [Calditrichaeota bacterium]|nr:MAG: YlxR family protein [Calditrichota bacterium]
MSSHIPIRTCIGCRQKKSKYELLRIVRTPQGTLEVDPEAKKPGRGAYFCYDEKCVKTGMKKKRIQHSLNVIPPANFMEELLKIIHEKSK